MSVGRRLCRRSMVFPLRLGQGCGVDLSRQLAGGRRHDTALAVCVAEEKRDERTGTRYDSVCGYTLG